MNKEKAIGILTRYCDCQKKQNKHRNGCHDWCPQCPYDYIDEEVYDAIRYALKQVKKIKKMFWN